MKIISLEPHASHRFDTGPDEVIVLPLGGSVTVEVDQAHSELDGRASVFDGPTAALGRGWSDDELEAELRRAAVPYTRPASIAAEAAGVLARNGIVACWVLLEEAAAISEPTEES